MTTVSARGRIVVLNWVTHLAGKRRALSIQSVVEGVPQQSPGTAATQLVAYRSGPQKIGS